MDEDVVDVEPAADAVAAFAEASKPDVPEIDDPRPGVFSLMYGIEVDGERHKMAEVRELNGADEEVLARLNRSKPNYPVVLVDTILRRAVVSLGGLPVNNRPELLSELLLGDREVLFKEILFATYGTTKEYEDVICSTCEKGNDIRVDFEGIIEEKGLETDEPIVENTLRNGVEVRMRFPTGADQMSVMQGDKLMSEPEQNTVMLGRVIETVNGKPIMDGENYARKLGLVDRKLLVDALVEGPSVRFKEDEVLCSHCGNRLPLVLGWADLLQL